MLRVFVGVDGKDLGMPLGRVRRRRMDRQLAEQTAERLMLIMRQVLVAEENDKVFHQRAVHLLELLIAERAGQIDPADLCADMWRQLFDFDGLIPHPSSSPRTNSIRASLRWRLGRP